MHLYAHNVVFILKSTQNLHFLAYPRSRDRLSALAAYVSGNDRWGAADGRCWISQRKIRWQDQ